ncbi:hypothetical protein Bbelb_073030 [Branchiostoma belcheri]|nr:hypothetical protein Bbelb_073030 [Branchiostoma belcheri]
MYDDGNLYNESIATEDYTEVPQRHNMPVSHQTTQMGHVVLLGGNTVINENGNTGIYMYIVAVPLLLVLTTTVVLLTCKFCRGTDLPPQDLTDDETPGDNNIEPYAEAYAVDSTQLQRSGGSSTTDRRPASAFGKTSEDNCTIQPYAVAYAEGQGSEIQPYAVAYDEQQIERNTDTDSNDPQHSDSHNIQPYAIGYPDSPQPARNHPEADSSPLENVTHDQATNVRQPLTQTQERSLSTADSVQSEYENCKGGKDVNPSAGNGQGPYGMEEVNEISGVLYKSGPQYAEEEKHSNSKGPYGLGGENEIPCESSVLYRSSSQQAGEEI